LAGKANRIKGYMVATEVFGRGSDFDQSIDPIVSIQASRLRQAIDRYYETAGKNDPLRIAIPRGAYVPEFDEQLPGHEHIAAEQAAQTDAGAAWPTVVVRPLANLSANSEDKYLAIGLTAELAHALSHYREIRVLEALHRDQKSPPPEMDFDFIVDGNIRHDPQGVNVAIRLSDNETGLQIWSGKYQGDLEAAEMISFQEDVAAEVAVRLTGGNALIPKHLSGLSKNKPVADLTTYEAMLRYWEYDTLRTPQSYVRAIEALEHATAREPGCGQTWSLLASLYADNYGLEMVDLPTPLEKAEEFARRGISLDPTNRRARAIVAYVQLMLNKLPEARYEAQTAYNMHSCSLMYLDAIGWLMALAGEWQRGEKIINKAIQINPYYRPWVRHAVFLNWFRIENYQKAYRETLNFMMPEFHWDPLLKASVCGHLGRIVEGQACVGALLALKPDFVQHGRILIGRYVKFEAITDRIIEGLGKLGLNIEA
ncbi:MAG: hypothetical protein QNL14_15085, partial [Deltaproteobacteria bacterium]|nr:hypothetical protein [Deltaproteobacteria bacterium]